MHISLEKEALRWNELEGAAKKVHTCKIVQQGIAAYAARQSALRKAMKQSFQAIWSNTNPNSLLTANDDESSNHSKLTLAVVIDDSDNEGLYESDYDEHIDY